MSHPGRKRERGGRGLIDTEMKEGKHKDMSNDEEA